MMTFHAVHGAGAWPRGASTAACALALALLAAPVHAGTPAPFAPPPAAERTLYRHATLIDGTGGPARAGMAVLVAGERIERVAPDADLSPETAHASKVVDLQGRFLLPGLIDAHVHLATPPNRRQAEAVLRRDLYGGVTAVRDMADDLRAVGDLARAAQVGEIPAPDVFYAALMAGPGFFADPRTAQTSAGVAPGHAPWMQAVTDATDLRLAVARAAGTSATALKLYADITPGLARRVVAEAHRQHLQVWAHATPFPARPSDMVAAGADVLSHACLLVHEGDRPAYGWGAPHAKADLARLRQGDDAALARLFTMMARRGTILDATIVTYGAEPAGPTSMPPLAPGACDDALGGILTRQAFRAGVPIAAGTDLTAPSPEPWPELFQELAALANQAGMPPAAVLHTATLVNARASGQARDMGSVEAGKLANLVVLAQDPLVSLDHLKSIVMTIKRGRPYPRGDFQPLQAGDVTDF